METASISSSSSSTNNTSSSEKLPFYKLKITLNDGCKRPIGGRWRKVVLPANFSLLELHVVIQVVFGWENYHLHLFESRGGSRGRFDWPAALVEYQIKDDEDDYMVDNCKEERLFKLSDIFSEEKSTLFYEYDFGASWEHEIKFEGILEATSELNYPTIVDGKGANRVEDRNDEEGYGDLKPEFLNKVFNKQEARNSLRKLYDGKWPHNDNLSQCYLCAFRFCSSCNGKCCSYCLKAELLKNPARLEESDSEDED